MTLRNLLGRRKFLALSALGVVAGAGLCGIGGVAGILLVRRRRQALYSEADTATPLPVPTLFPLPIVERSAWGALAPNHAAEAETGFATQENPLGWHVYQGDLAAIYRTIAVHHSAIQRDTDTMLALQQLHLNTRKWADIGYHYGIGADGTIYEGRTLGVRGANVENANWGTAGIVLMGNFEREIPTEAQVSALKILILWLKAQYPFTHLAAHGDFNPKTECPGAALKVLLDPLAVEVGLLRGTGGYSPPPPNAFPSSTPPP